MSATSILQIREADVLERQATHLIGTLGHVSEGKSTLVRALTGVRTQRHAAEQQRNITIHLGYANCKIWQHNTTGAVQALGTREPAPADSTLVAHLSFVDCPGHEAYLATMLGGAGVMDTACLIIASNQSVIPQPQTHEHLIAAELMGLDRISVVQNKCDLVDLSGATAAIGKIREFVNDTIAGEAPIFPVSAQHGWGVSRVLDWLLALPPPPRSLNAPARLTCVRSFDVNRPGPVVVGGPPLAGAVIGGPLETGVLAVGDWLEVRPGLLKAGRAGTVVVQPLVTRVRGIRCENAELPVAVPGSLLAIATDLDPALSASNGMVGQRIGVPGTLPPIVGEIVIAFRRLKRDTFAFGRHRVGDRLRICSGVATVEGTLIECVAGHARGRAIRVRLDRPLCLGVGEQVSVLRRHEEAGRELFEGIGSVLEVEDWPDIEPAEGAALAVAPARTVEWIPAERPAFSVATVPTYTDLLRETMIRREELTEGSRLRLIEPRVDRVGRQTAWLNWAATHASLSTGAPEGTLSYQTHFRDFVERELLTSGSENAEEQLLLRGTWRVDDLRSLLTRYIETYKLCLQCRGTQTGLVHADGVLKVRCDRCRCENVTEV